MNFTEQHKANGLAFIVPMSEIPALEWKGYTLCVTMLMVGFGIYALFAKKGSSAERQGLRRNEKITVDPGSDTAIRELSGYQAPVTYNDEVCPICFGPPKMGVKAPCGHLLCADCLANYCKIRIIPMPLPCPLCRAPLNSVTLVSDFATSVAGAALADEKMLDLSTIMVQDWIRKYNMCSRQFLLLTRLFRIFSVLIVVMFVMVNTKF